MKVFSYPVFYDNGLFKILLCFYEVFLLNLQSSQEHIIIGARLAIAGHQLMR